MSLLIRYRSAKLSPVGIALVNAVRPSAKGDRDAIPQLKPPSWVDPERTPVPKRFSIPPRTGAGSLFHAIRTPGLRSRSSDNRAARTPGRGMSNSSPASVHRSIDPWSPDSPGKGVLRYTGSWVAGVRP